MSKRIAILATVPDGTDPSEVLDDMMLVFNENYGIEGDDGYGESSEITVVDPYVDDSFESVRLTDSASTTSKEHNLMQDHELTAWLGDVEATPEQRDSLMRASDMIDSRYPGETRRRDYGATAFNTAAQVILGDATLADVAEAWRKARRAERDAMAALTGAIIAASEDLPETHIAEHASVDRQTVRKALSKKR